MGSPTPTLEGSERYIEGIQGHGLVVGDGGACVEYATAGNYDLRESTVSFWIKPLDWEGTDDRFHVFFQCSSPAGANSRGSRLLYKYLVPGRFLMLAIPDGEIPYVNYQGAAYAYHGHHPIPRAFGGGYCYIDGAHYHLFAPEHEHSANFAIRNGYYYYAGIFPGYYWYYRPYYYRPVFVYRTLPYYSGYWHKRRWYRKRWGRRAGARYYRRYRRRSYPRRHGRRGGWYRRPRGTPRRASPCWCPATSRFATT